MCQAKTTVARPVQGPRPPVSTQRMVGGLEALDQLQLWSTRRVRIAYLTQPKPLAG
nr:hypothetical protein [uncultured Roseateles sp.]